MAGRRTAPKQPDAGELVRVRVTAKHTEAVRVGGIWLTPGGHEEVVRYGDAQPLLKNGAIEVVAS